MSIAIIWLVGTIISNAFMDVMTMLRYTPAKPTVYGVINTTLHVQRLNVPKPYRVFNIYFSVLLTWAMAFVALFAIVVMVITKNADNGEGKAG